jgi:hypothetical protein
VPEPGNPQSLNRFSYVLNNPLGYIDPSGHTVVPYNNPLLGLRIADISGWPDWAKKAAWVASLFLPLNVDLEKNEIATITLEQACYQSVMVLSPVSLESGFASALGNAGKGTPHGFKSPAEFQAFGDALKEGLEKAGYTDVKPAFQGSSVTGVKFTRGKPFDVGRVSDFDIALASRTLLEKAKGIGVQLRTHGTRTAPLTPPQIEALGLRELVAELSAVVGRPVKFMIFETLEAVLQKGPSIPVP